MKLLADFFPVLLFFIAYKFAGIYVATGLAIGMAFLQVVYTAVRYKKADAMQISTLILLAVLGGATLWLHDEIFIKWKPTVINWLFGAAFLFSEFVGSKTLIQRLMEAQVTLPVRVWLRLNRSWMGFFLAMGTVNLYVVYHFGTEAWINFKLFGMLGMTLIFVLLQAMYLSKHLMK